MKRADAVGGVLLAAIGVYAAFQAYKFGLGTFAQPGAGFFPMLGAVLVAGCSLATIVLALSPGRRRLPGPEESPRMPLKAWVRIALCVLALLVYPAVLPILGFPASTFLFMLALSRFDSTITWRGAFAIASLGALAFWLLFVWVLGVQLPQSMLGI